MTDWDLVVVELKSEYGPASDPSASQSVQRNWDRGRSKSPSSFPSRQSIQLQRFNNSSTRADVRQPVLRQNFRAVEKLHQQSSTTVGGAL